MAKAKKKRAEQYDPKLKIHGGFGDVIKVAMRQPPSAPYKSNERAERRKIK